MHWIYTRHSVVTHDALATLRSPFKLWLVTTAGLMAVLLAEPAPAAVIRVEADGSGDQPTIQAALVVAAGGDVIELGDGVYRGPGNREIRFLGKDVSVLSASGNAESCVIDCEGSSSNPYRGFLFIDGETNAAVLQGVSVVNGWKDDIQFPLGDGAGVFIDDSAPVIRDCIFERNFAQRGGAIATSDADGVVLERCIFRDNHALITGGGVLLHGRGMMVQGCLFTGNLADGVGGGLIVEVHAAAVAILETTLAGNRSFWGGGFASGAEDVSFERTLMWGNCADDQGDDGWFATTRSAATFVCCALDPSKIHSGSVTYEGEQVTEDPRFCEPDLCTSSPTAAGDYHLDAASPCLPTASPCGLLIGALGQGCGSVPTSRSSWGAIKARFAPREMIER
jgi:hypothetical protein